MKLATISVEGIERKLLVAVDLPLKIISEANQREHWAQKARRAKFQRQQSFLALRASGASPNVIQAHVRLTRIGGRRLDDDNLAGGFKAVRDGVADWLGLDDGSNLLSWSYAQRKGNVKEYGVLIEVFA